MSWKYGRNVGAIKNMIKEQIEKLIKKEYENEIVKIFNKDIDYKINVIKLCGFYNSERFNLKIRLIEKTNKKLGNVKFAEIDLYETPFKIDVKLELPSKLIDKSAIGDSYEL